MNNAGSGLRWTDDNELILDGIAEKLFIFFDTVFKTIAQDMSAHEYIVPSLLPKQFLTRIDYLSSFPHEALRVVAHQPGKKGRLPQWYLPRAVCYHLFRHWADTPLPSPAIVASAAARCFRWEEQSRAVGLRSFHMREIVGMGTKKHIDMLLRTVQQRVMAEAQVLQLPLRLVPAVDPFYLPSARGKYMLQKLKGLKTELTYDHTREGNTAIGSFNRHENFFVTRLNITPRSSPIESCCIAFGIERWVLAFLDMHGEDPSRWPPAVRKIV